MIPVRVVVKALAALLMMWGIWLIPPYWDVFGQGNQYQAMLAIMPEVAWGAAAFAWGAGMFYAANRVAVTAMKNLLFGLFLFWIFLGTFYAIGNWRAASTAIYTGVALVTGGIWAFLSYEERRKEERLKLQ